MSRIDNFYYSERLSRSELDLRPVTEFKAVSDEAFNKRAESKGVQANKLDNGDISTGRGDDRPPFLADTESTHIRWYAENRRKDIIDFEMESVKMCLVSNQLTKGMSVRASKRLKPIKCH